MYKDFDYRPSSHELKGMIFGRWTVISYFGKKRQNEGHLWLCRCECGIEKEVREGNLLCGGSRGCSECHRKSLKSNKPKNRDLAGETFGKWTVISYLGRLRHDHPYWLCRCECGVEREVFESNLVTGKSISCGGTGCVVRKHGKSGTRVYSIWENMISRCQNPNNFSYYLYGGRGITVCEEWKSFENFYNDMGDPPDGYSIDRIDPDLGYFPENCRWASSLEQASNKTGVRRRITVEPISFNGETKTIHQWAKDIGIHGNTLTHRLRSGWPIEKALTTPSLRAK
jgi:hypothetical protein